MYNCLTSAFPLSLCAMLRFTVRFQRITHLDYTYTLLMVKVTFSLTS
jgi:hypothetical protein